jgi:hypothetical protein
MESRGSTRVALERSIDVECAAGRLEAVTAIVNLQGALIRTIKPLRKDLPIFLTVYLTGKGSAARVVYVSPGNPLKYGVALEKPQNIWGLAYPPDDWRRDLRTR